jgi:hypothetical protein
VNGEILKENDKQAQSADREIRGVTQREFSIGKNAKYKVLHIDKNSMTLERISGSMGYTHCNPRIVKLIKVS